MKKSVVVLIVILILLVLGMGGYLVYDKVLSKDEVKEEKVEKKEEVNESNTSKEEDANDISNLILDSSKCINKKNMEYSLSSSIGISNVNINYNNEENILTIGVNPEIVKQEYNIDIDKDYSDPYIVSLDKKIVDIIDDRFGQGIGYETIFLLMEDGTVEYIPYYYALKNNSFIAYKLNDIEKIVRLHSVSAYTNGPGSYHTVIAQKQDGTFYDAFELILNLQYYNDL